MQRNSFIQDEDFYIYITLFVISEINYMNFDVKWTIRTF